MSLSYCDALAFCIAIFHVHAFDYSLALMYEIFSLRQDDVLSKIADRVKNFAVIYLCDIEQTPDFNAMYVPFLVCAEQKC